MGRVTSKDLLAVIEDLKAQVSALAERVARFEGAGQPSPELSAKASFAPSSSGQTTKDDRLSHVAPTPGGAPAGAEPQALSEQEVLAISAAIAAYLGVRVHIRQIRLISSHMWAQEGRASVQASHRLHN